MKTISLKTLFTEVIQRLSNKRVLEIGKYFLNANVINRIRDNLHFKQYASNTLPNYYSLQF